MPGIFASTLTLSLMITAFVLFMMVVIEYINVQSRNVWAQKLKKSPFMQIIIAAFLGITPGCMGAFTVVSLYTHRMMGLAGLIQHDCGAGEIDTRIGPSPAAGHAFLPKSNPPLVSC